MTTDPRITLALRLQSTTDRDEAVKHLCDAIDAGITWADARAAVNEWDEMRAREVTTWEDQT